MNERNVWKLYRQFLFLLGASSQGAYKSLKVTADRYSGLIWAMDALLPEGNGMLLYVLYEVLSGKPIATWQGEVAPGLGVSSSVRGFVYQPYSYTIFCPNCRDATWN